MFKGASAADLYGAMDFMAASLGVSCDYCHTESPESDNKPAKVSARAMVTMTRDLNKSGFSGYDVVNCYTCHRGQVQPLSVPGSADESTTTAATPGIQSAGALPAIDQVVERYFQALGGEQAISKLPALRVEGKRTRETADRQKLTETLLLHLPAFAADGGKNVDDSGSGDPAITAGRAWFLPYLKLKQTYPRMTVLGREAVSGRDAFMVGAVAADGQRVKLYFDASDGLLLRRIVTRKTILGTLLNITDFADYRLVAGVKIPFRTTHLVPPVRITDEVKVMEPNKEEGLRNK